MKKIVATVLAFSLFLIVAPVTNAAEVCPSGSQYGSLCGIFKGENTTLFQNIFSLLLFIAVGLSLGFLLYGGIKWITSGGDKGKLDGARSTITAAVVGLIISFLAFFIIGLVSYLFGINSTNGTLFTLPKLTDTK